VVGCDYPLLQSVDIQSLIAAREGVIDAIAYFNEQEQEIEPMIALWELQAQRNFLEAFSKGNDSPRRILRACKLKMIVPRKSEILTNRNAK
jgi:molybdopterin-guanine dinucleotide biosynthesis protein A